MPDRIPEQSSTRQVCRCCGEPVLRGQPHWAGDREGHPWHYACAENSGLTIPWRPLRPAARPASEDPHPIGRELEPVSAGR